MPLKAACGWSPEEDNLLREAVFKHGGKRWRAISGDLLHRTPGQCNARWNELQSLNSSVKTPWRPDEDQRMAQLVAMYGPGRWAVISSFLPGRNGKQCRERWHNQLNPSIKKESWTPEEDRTIIELQAKLGNAWAKIANRLDGRTDNAVKNRWHSSLLKSNTRRLVRKKRQQHAGSSGTRPRKSPKAKKQSSRAMPKHSRGGGDGVTSPDAVDAERLRVAAPPPPPSPSPSPSASPTVEIKMECNGQPSWDEGVSGVNSVGADLRRFPPSDGGESPLMKLLACDDVEDNVEDDSLEAEPGSYADLLLTPDYGLAAFDRVRSAESGGTASRRLVATDDLAIDDAFRPSAGVDAPLAVSGVSCKIEPSLLTQCRFDDDNDADGEASRALYHSVWKGSSPTPVAVAPPLALPDAFFSGGYSFPMPASHEDGASFLYGLGGGDILL
ncbi:hypothetical protein PybrP1_011967 [[Pythium] brassicae (nom. inval.)]|nr:hypothetical protein PybrP1_011967 [[Pythium] brassicae (nom. inval.)]